MLWEAAERVRVRAGAVRGLRRRPRGPAVAVSLAGIRRGRDSGARPRREIPEPDPSTRELFAETSESMHGCAPVFAYPSLEVHQTITITHLGNTLRENVCVCGDSPGKDMPTIPFQNVDVLCEAAE